MTTRLSHANDPEQARVCILDYGSGNVQSVRNLVSTITESVTVSNHDGVIEAATHLILPGVGAFGASMERIRATLPLALLSKEVLERGKPFLGICVGMQVLAEQGSEFGMSDGLGWLPGMVRRLVVTDRPLPHVGWNSIEPERPSLLLTGLEDGVDYYFVHSYVYDPPVPELVAARTEYGERFCSVVQHDNIFGVQFHPEKSQKAGELLIRNFLSLA